ncbi:MAG: YgiQ family radical SAM protein [Chloroflexi bacterium]|nr:YgiQ family radical SAM protein [Chloroflexota bacterium]
MYLPTTAEEFKQLGWQQADILLVSGDSYIDSPFIGAAVIGKALAQAGFKVGIIAQPDLNTPDDITRLGKPRLFWGVTGGCVDSMVANYTASRKKRRTDDYTPGGVNDRRPDRAVIAYSNLIRRHFKNTVPIVLGGIEASLRRVTHYDFWSNALRRPILFDAKATYLLYGMAESSVVELANCLHSGGDPTSLRGLSYISNHAPEGYLQLPAHEEAAADKMAFIELFHMFYQNNDPVSASGLCQRVGDRMLVQNPPAPYPDQAGMDAIHAQPYELDQHPYYARQGAVRALETIRFAISTHRGCYGECNFCAIAVHEGRTVRWRSEQSILAEAERIAAHPDFKGYIQDVGGPTANMYGFECAKKLKLGSCPDRRCLYPEICPALKIDHSRQVSLLRKIRKIPGVKKAFVASGIRYDMVLKDKAHGREYLKEIVDFHVSGQLKVAPEHTDDAVLRRMGKPGARSLLEFKQMFDELNREAGRNQFLTYYLIAAYPGCSDAEMRQLRQFAGEKLHIHPEQVQIFTPTPSTYGSLMYYTEMDPFTLEPLFIEKDPIRKERQKQIVVDKGNARGRPR